MNYNKILFLIHLPPPVHGSSIIGKTIRVSETINKNFDCRYINLLASQNVAESGKVSIRKILGFVVTWLRVFFTLVKHRPQLCYLALTTTGTAFYKDILLVVLLKLLRIKRVYHLHNKGVSQHLHNPINRLCYRYVFKDTAVILLSRHLYSDIQQFVPLGKVHICNNGIADERQKTKGKRLEAEKIVRILFLSNLIESKGVFVLLEACEILKKKEITFECVFIGGEGDVTASRLNDLIQKKGLASQVFFQGKKYSVEKNQAFSEVDIFAFPTYYSKECFPLVLLEAMCYSLPVISTYEGGIPDIVEDSITGYLVPQKNVEALAEKLELLIKNPDLRQQMGAAGRRKYEQEFTLEIFEKKMVDILQLILSKNEKY